MQTLWLTLPVVNDKEKSYITSALQAKKIHAELIIRCLVEYTELLFKNVFTNFLWSFVQKTNNCQDKFISNDNFHVYKTLQLFTSLTTPNTNIFTSIKVI